MGIEVDTFVFYGTALTPEDVELLDLEDELHIRDWAIMPIGGNQMENGLLWYLVYKPSLNNIASSSDFEPIEIRISELHDGIERYLGVNPIDGARKSLSEVTNRFELAPHIFDWYVTTRIR